ncbi:27 kDa glycoprotein-like [Ostrinia nubilalis]|uniref:27 kDa glycoprotein-like n=1 Tax=Ostrinia nubilalis TaxID=29057 RepID=UPI0030822B51
MVKYVPLLFLLFGLAWAQSEFSLPENFTLPPELEGKVDENQLKGLQNQTLPVIKKKCEENGGPTAYDNAQKAFENFSSCLKALVDPAKLQAEIEEASPNGQVDEVFKGYCAKTPQFKSCFTDMTNAVRPCFSEKERNNLKTVYNVTEQLAEFICYKEGDRIARKFVSTSFSLRAAFLVNTLVRRNATTSRQCTMSPSNWPSSSATRKAIGLRSEKERNNLKTVYNVTEQLAEFICYKEGDMIALFIAEGGRECFQDKQEQLQECTNRTLGADFKMDPNNLSADSIPNIAFGEKECRQLSELQLCVVGVLETCEAPTTGNIVESMFKFIRKATPCSDVAETKQNRPGSASGLAVTSATVLLGLFAALYV